MSLPTHAENLHKLKELEYLNLALNNIVKARSVIIVACFFS